MTATRLRYVLIGLIILMIGGFGFGAYWLQGLLAADTLTTNHAKIDAELMATELQQLKGLEKQLSDDQDVIARAKQVAAPADSYQDQVIKDVSAYAARYGIQVNTVDFTSTSTQQQTVGGAKKVPFTVTLKGPLPYVTFMKFLRDIEKNLTKMQVTSLTLAPDKDPNNITNPSLGLEVYVKK